MDPSAATPRLLFVCTGNICRSPMAELLAIDHGRLCGRPVEARSASVLGLRDQPAHKHAVRVMSEIGLDLSRHRSQPVTRELVQWADHILVMEVAHATELRRRYPEAGDKVMLLGTFDGAVEIADPLGRWRGRFRECRDQIRRAVQAFIEHLGPPPAAP